MKHPSIAIITDLHLRSDYYPGFLEKQVETLLLLLAKKRHSHVVINGDIFEKRNPRAEELMAFDYLLNNIKSEVIINRGNHDTLRKDGSSDTILSLYDGKAKVIQDTESVQIGSHTFDFIPHYEDDAQIIAALKKNPANPVFGHFGFQGCASNSTYMYASDVKLTHLKKHPYVFLGHIHKPQVFGKTVYIMGTQYTVTFGEANAQKYFHEVICHPDRLEIIKTPINHGIKHLSCNIHELDDTLKHHNPKSFFTLLRVKIDKLDAHVEDTLKEKIYSQYAIKHLELVFDDILPKFDSGFQRKSSILSLDDAVIEDYVENSRTVFSKSELFAGLELIKGKNSNEVE